MKDGESGADVYDRVSVFFETLYRDFKKDNYPENTLLLTHGMTFKNLFNTAKFKWWKWVMTVNINWLHHLKNAYKFNNFWPQINLRGQKQLSPAKLDEKKQE